MFCFFWFLFFTKIIFNRLKSVKLIKYNQNVDPERQQIMKEVLCRPGWGLSMGRHGRCRVVVIVRCDR